MSIEQIQEKLLAATTKQRRQKQLTELKAKRRHIKSNLSGAFDLGGETPLRLQQLWRDE